MTPKEKADELVYKMKSIIENSGLHALFDYDCFKSAAVKCVILEVEEIIIEAKIYDFSKYGRGKSGFWNEVLNELKSML